MNTEKSAVGDSRWTLLEKLRVVVAAKGLSGSPLDELLEREGIDAARLQEFHREAAAAIGAPPPKSRVDELIEGCASADDATRREAAKQLGHIGFDARPAIPILVERLGDADVGVRSWTAWALGKIDPQSPTVWGALLNSIRDEDSSVRSWCVVGLLGSQDDSIVTTLIDYLADERADVRATAAWALGRMGSRAAPALPRLEASIEDAVESVRAAAREASAKIAAVRPES